MNSTGYKILGFLVWRGALWYVKRTYGRYLPSRRVAGIAAATTAVSLAVVAASLASRRHES